MTIILTAAEERDLHSAFSALDSGMPSDAAIAGTPPRELFCRYWPIVKQVLEVLRDLPGIPAPLKGAVTLVVAGGDAASRVLCR
jgi:hypothetical protein